MANKDIFSKELQVKKILLEGVLDSVKSTDIEEVRLSLERVTEAVKELELKKDKFMNSMLELENETIEAVRDWAQKQKQEINPFKEVRIQLKQQIDKLLAVERERALQKELEKQRVVMQEAAKIRKKQEQEQEEVQKKQRDDEEKWMLRNLEIEQEKVKMHQFGAAQKTQTVKLQKGVSSLIGTVSCISSINYKDIDMEILRKVGMICQRLDRMDKASETFMRLKENHRCQKNYEGSAPGMELAGTSWNK